MSDYWVKPYRPGGEETYEAAKERYGKLIKQSDLDHWRKHGYVIIEKLFSPDELKEIHHGLQKYMPTYENYKAHPFLFKELYGESRGILKGSNAETVRYEFPYQDDALNNAAVHPFLCAFAERLSEQKDLILSHGAIVGKYAGKGDYEQDLHMDYSNNTPVIPAKDTKSIDLPMIIYHSDVSIDLGPTYVLGWEHTEHRNFVQRGVRMHSKKEFPELYEHEKPAVVPAGSVLIYSMRTFHRGSAMTAKTGSRFIQFTAFHSANTPWLGSMAQQNMFGSPRMNHFLLNADPGQRALVGFPPAGHEYWKDPEVLEGVANRYPTMDMRPYGGGPPKFGEGEKEVDTKL